MSTDTAKQIHDKVYICSCSMLSHAVRFSWDSELQELFIDVSLIKSKSIWRRIKESWRHLWGNDCDFGDCAEVLLNKSDVEHLIENMQKMIKNTPNA